MLASSFIACDFFGNSGDNNGDNAGDNSGNNNTSGGESVDYATEVTLDESSGTKKLEVTVKLFIDGDTTHFYVPRDAEDYSEFTDGILKARYLGINTPESTGRIEEWGKAAAKFTREKLEGATKIIVESDTDKWNKDSNGRHLVWVWYLPAGETEYRNLNVEIMQEGLAIQSNSANNRYGTTVVAAFNQAKTNKLHVHSKEKDPDFYYGAAHELTIKELRANIEFYANKSVAFEGLIVEDSDGSIYLQQYDEETGLYYGITAYYGTAGLPGQALEFFKIGNVVRVVGKVQYWEAGGTYQISGLTYSVMKPTAPENVQLVSEGNEVVFPETSAEDFVSGKVNITYEDAETGEDKTKEYDYSDLVIHTTIAMKGLTVTSVYTTTTQSSYGEMTLTCTSGGKTVVVRTAVLKDANGNTVTEDAFLGKTIDVIGSVDTFSGKSQIRVFSI